MKEGLNQPGNKIWIEYQTFITIAFSSLFLSIFHLCSINYRPSCSTCFVGTSFITSFFNACKKNVRIIIFFGAFIWYQSFSEMFAEFCFCFLQRKWSLLNDLQWLGNFDTPFQKSVMGFFPKRWKNDFFWSGTTTHYFFCSILSDNKFMCGFFKKKKCSKKMKHEEAFLEKQFELKKKSRTHSKRFVIVMSRVVNELITLEIAKHRRMITFRLFPGYFSSIICVHTQSHQLVCNSKSLSPSFWFCPEFALSLCSFSFLLVLLWFFIFSRRVWCQYDFPDGIDSRGEEYIRFPCEIPILHLSN